MWLDCPPLQAVSLHKSNHSFHLEVLSRGEKSGVKLYRMSAQLSVYTIAYGWFTIQCNS